MRPPMTHDPAVAQIAEAIGRGGHSKLYRWLWDNHAEIERSRTGRADWISATAALNKIGFTNRDKTALKPENVRKIWARVVRDRAKAAAEKKSRTQSPTTAPAHAVQPVQQRSTEQPPRAPDQDGGLERVMAAMGAKSEMTKPLKR